MKNLILFFSNIIYLAFYISEYIKSIFKYKLNKIILSSIFILFSFYIMFVNYIEPNQIGIVRNIISGKMYVQEHGGFYFTAPWVFVIRVDTSPIRVSLMSGGKGYSSKLVQFQKEYWEEFVNIEGFRYYWWSNRFSINFGYTEEYRGMKDILRGHAYGAKQYKFIKTLMQYDEIK